MRLTSRIAFLVLPLALTAWLQAQISMRAGLWENTVTAGGKTATRTTCVTPEQERDSKLPLEAMRVSIEKNLAKTGACKLKELTIAGATRSVLMVCGNMTMKNSTTFHADSFETTSSTTTPEGVKSSVIKGRRIADCPAGGPK